MAHVDLSGDEIRVLMKHWEDRLRKNKGTRTKVMMLCTQRIELLRSAFDVEMNKPPADRINTKAW